MKKRPAIQRDKLELFTLFRAAFHTHVQEIWGWDESWQRSNLEKEFASAETSVIDEGADCRLLPDTQRC
ncbi:hypothetical protein WG219_06625 [Ectopseudomonas mendocina]|uniref:Uncharacterized protein n=1 Tax=Ectopseudomonas mendocina TaxID=300 RepID=A0ABZ2RM01_ECTME